MEKRKTNPHLSRKRNFQFDGVINMKIREVNENKKQFIALLLLADEQENMEPCSRCRTPRSHPNHRAVSRR